MLASDLNALLRVPGRLCINPTDLAQPFPYLGTSLGLVRDIVAMPGQKVARYREENLGHVTTAALKLGQKWALTAVVRAMEQGLGGSFYEIETGASSGEPGIVHNPVTTPPGQYFVPVKLLFAPLDELLQFFIYFPAALLFVDEAARIGHSIGREAGDPVAALATPNAADGYVVKRKKKEDLVL